MQSSFLFFATQSARWPAIPHSTLAFKRWINKLWRNRSVKFPLDRSKTVSKKKSVPTQSSPAKGTKKESSQPAISIAENRKARHEYQILETVECGLVLRGTEVKSLRTGKCSIEEAYGRTQGNELWLVGCDIPEYKQALYWNHEPKRPRKLLLHRRELNRWLGKTKEKGLTLVPLKLYFSERGLAKCTMALCKGLQLHDKRQVVKQKEARREIERAVRRRVP